MPKAAINEYDRLVACQYKVWCTWQIASVQPESVTEPVDHRTYN